MWQSFFIIFKSKNDDFFCLKFCSPFEWFTLHLVFILIESDVVKMKKWSSQCCLLIPSTTIQIYCVIEMTQVSIVTKVQPEVFRFFRQGSKIIIIVLCLLTKMFQFSSVLNLWVKHMTFNFFIATVKLVIKAETDKNLNKDMSALKSF